MFEKRVKIIKEIVQHPTATVAAVGAALADTALEKTGELLKTQKKKR
jgi:hypothetical protein